MIVQLASPTPIGNVTGLFSPMHTPPAQHTGKCAEELNPQKTSLKVILQQMQHHDFSAFAIYLCILGRTAIALGAHFAAEVTWEHGTIDNFEVTATGHSSTTTATGFSSTTAAFSSTATGRAAQSYALPYSQQNLYEIILKPKATPFHQHTVSLHFWAHRNHTWFRNRNYTGESHNCQLPRPLWKRGAWHAPWYKVRMETAELTFAGA